MTKKIIITLVVFVGAGLILKRFMPSMGSVDWEQKFARMPDNAPPKWMFRNIGEIHDNTDRIIELLENAPAQ